MQHNCLIVALITISRKKTNFQNGGSNEKFSFKIFPTILHTKKKKCVEKTIIKQNVGNIFVS